ncbi:KRAB-A domain-containing protein 2 [Trichonephila clavipes]|nr:KRAB-A domain-containing protein 2 [Trichonephila clavipes]
MVELSVIWNVEVPSWKYFRGTWNRLECHLQTIALVQIVDAVRIQAPDVDRGRTDNRNVLAVVVVGIEDSDFYKLANKNGTLKQLYTRNQFVICKENLRSIDEIYFQEMSLREAAAANSRRGGQDYTRCHCKRN